MPPLLTSDLLVDRPPVQRSPHRMVPVIRKPPPPKGRQYGDEPLPYKPSEVAPRKATIKQRVALPDRVAYTLDIGGVEIEDVGIHEVLDYVSPYDLEQFEHRQFEEEGEILRIALMEKEAERQRRKQRAKTKGKVVYQSESESGPDGQGVEEEEVETGRHGRARPTYTHLFKAPEFTQRKEPKERQRKRRRKRNPITGELMPLSDSEDEAFVASTKVKIASSPPTAAPLAELPKRRRRKRDKVTGELLPLSPIEPNPGHTKRPRRRRHPVTGELMPLGWRYDPDHEDDSPAARREHSGEPIPSMNRLSIARERDAKRVKLTSEEPSSSDELSPTQARGKIMTKAESLRSEQISSSSSQEPQVSSSKSKQTPMKTSMLQPTLQSASRLRPPSSAGDSSSGPQITLALFLESSKRNEDVESSDDDSSSAAEGKVKTPASRGKTSIMNPTAVKAESESEDDEDENDDLQEGEWFVEAILAHRLSDARSHPGRKPTMLYQTKWEGWDEPTWEPVDSFVDRSVIDDYRRRAGLDRSSQGKKIQTEPEPEPKKKANVPIVIDLSDDEEGFEVEKILAHHMSDPRTHPGKPATMLYQVKWRGWKDPTWEPRRSFTDKAIVRRYESSVGMKVAEDIEMDT